MLLAPRKRKYRKEQRGTIKGVATRGNKISFGTYALQSLESKWVSAQELEACRTTIQKIAGKDAKLIIRVFPHKPITAKPLETRMGTGKGEPEYYAAVIKEGNILFELDNVTQSVAKIAFYNAAMKLSVKTRMITRQ
ncbi:MAG: 50S ribosomal protein L16 [Planctomycetota bacterium]